MTPRQNPSERLLKAADALVRETGWASWGPIFAPSREVARELRLAVAYAKRFGK